jgi:hypothetical protein
MKKQRPPAYFFPLFRAFVDMGLRDMERSEVVSYLVLLRATRSDGMAQISYASLAERGGVTRRQAIRAVKSLVARGLVAIVDRGGWREGASIYCVTPDGVAAFARSLSGDTAAQDAGGVADITRGGEASIQTEVKHRSPDYA